MIQLVSVILALLIEVLVGVILIHLFEDDLARGCSNKGIREVTLPCKVYVVRNVSSYLKDRGMQILKQEVRKQQQEQEVKNQEIQKIRFEI